MNSDVCAAPSRKPKVLSTTEMTRRAQRFVAEWKGAVRENADAQSWWNALFTVFGLERRDVAVFEQRAKRASTGERGRIDIFMPGVMIGEAKSLGKDLEVAEDQALDYLATGEVTAAEMPRYVVSTDLGGLIRIRDLESPSDEPVQFRVQDLAKNIRQFAFLSGYRAPKRAVRKQEAVTVEAARAMGALYDALLGDVDASADDYVSQQAAIFMTRLLFLLYGDDAVGLWDPGLFEEFIAEHTAEDGSDTGALISQFFQELDKPLERRSANLSDVMRRAPFVNGALFRERVDIPTFTSDMRKALLRACEEEWSGVSPAIFGSLFQGMSSAAKRRRHGEHYTSEANILKALRPLFLDEMEERLKAAWPSVRALEELHETFADMRYIDPAMGSGNFLILAYREMRDIELRLLERLRELRGEQTAYALDGTWNLKVSPDQFGGIEINWWPAKIAETAMFLVDHQANQRMAKTLGAAPERLPIKLAPKIVHGNALQLNWRDHFDTADNVTYVFGNPPFLGKEQRTDAQTADMEAVWGSAYSGEMDYVTTWFILAAEFLDDRRGRFAFVSTNSIAQGVVVRPLFKPLREAGWRISFAHRTFVWTSEATGKAGVHCVIVGLTRRDETPRLFNYELARGEPIEQDGVSSINAYLVARDDIWISERSNPLQPALASNIKFGSMAADDGGLFLSKEEAEELLADEATASYVKRFVGAKELIHSQERWCLWMPEPNVKLIRDNPIVKRHVKATRAFRATAKDKNVRKDHVAPYRFHRVKQPTTNYLCIPAHFAESRAYATVAYLDPEFVAGNANFTTDDADGFLFAVISSAMFITWQKTVGGRIRNDPRFSSRLVWNNYPFPAVTATERKRLIEAGKAVLAARDAHPTLSLADLYEVNAMPTDLIKAHAALDRITDRLFGFAKPPSEVARQTRLFDRYVEMTSVDDAS